MESLGLARSKLPFPYYRELQSVFEETGLLVVGFASEGDTFLTISWVSADGTAGYAPLRPNFSPTPATEYRCTCCDQIVTKD